MKINFPTKEKKYLLAKLCFSLQIPMHPNESGSNRITFEHYATKNYFLKYWHSCLVEQGFSGEERGAGRHRLQDAQLHLGIKRGARVIANQSLPLTTTVQSQVTI